MFNVYFYKFHKKNNSTKTPVDTEHPPITVPCLLRDSTSLISPVLEIEADTVSSNSLTKYNYAFIQGFNRYYFINNYVYENNIWHFYLSCDVLGSFYSLYLSETTQHIIRTSDSTRGDADLPDSFYKTKIGRIGSGNFSSGDYVYTKSNYSAHYNRYTWGDYFSYSSDGCYIVGVVNINGKGLTYYRMDETSFNDFITKVLQISISMSTGSGSLNDNLARSIYDPIQYIKYCRWFPVNAYIPGGGTNSLYVGSQPITLGTNCLAYLVTPEKGIMINGGLLSIPKNIYGGTLRKYLSLSPYSEYNLYFPTLGMVPLDSARMYKYVNIELKWITDYLTGKTDFYVIPTNRTTLAADNDPTVYIPGSNSDAMFYSALSLGVDVPLYNLSLDFETGVILTGISWLDNKLNPRKEFEGTDSSTRRRVGSDIPDTVGSRKYVPNVQESSVDTPSKILKAMTDFWTDGTASSLGQLKSQGTPASYMSYCDLSFPFITAMFYTQETMQLNKYGMPSDFTAKLSTLGECFIMCKNPQFNVDGPTSGTESIAPVITREEQNLCMDFLANGIYIEVDGH